MLFRTNRTELLAALANRLGNTERPTHAIFSEILEISNRAAMAGQGRAAANLMKLVECEAWTEAALASIELFSPRWKLCRLIYDNGEWFCSLSSQRDLPDWLDEVIETQHSDLCLAILKAVVEAMRNNHNNPTPQLPSPRRRQAPQDLVLCQHFV